MSTVILTVDFVKGIGIGEGNFTFARPIMTKIFVKILLLSFSNLVLLRGWVASWTPT